MNPINPIRELSLYLVLLAAVAAYLLSCGHLWEAQKWNQLGQERDRAFRTRVGLWFLAIAVLLSVALLVNLFNFRLR
jgi:hypothetical protein